MDEDWLIIAIQTLNKYNKLLYIGMQIRHCPPECSNPIHWLCTLAIYHVYA